MKVKNTDDDLYCEVEEKSMSVVKTPSLLLSDRKAWEASTRLWNADEYLVVKRNHAVPWSGPSVVFLSTREKCLCTF